MSNQFSFLPDDYMERKAQRRTNVICATLFAIVVVAIGTAFTFTEKSLRAVEKEHAKVELDYAEAARKLEQVEKMQEAQRKMAHQAELTASLLEKVPRTFLLAEITNSLPKGVSLLDMAMTSVRRVSAPVVPTAAGKSDYEIKKAAREAKKTAGATAGAIEPKLCDVTIKMTGIAATDVQVAQFISRLNQSRLLRDVNLVVSDELVNGDEKLRKFVIEMQLNPSAEVGKHEPRPGASAAVETQSR